MIKHFRLFSMICLLVALIFSPAAAQDYPPDIQRIIDRGKLIVAMYYKDIPPFFMHDAQGHLYGVDVKLSKDIAAKLGVEVEFNRNATTFNEIVDMVVRHEADVAISLLSITLERSKRVSFSKPYLVLRQGLLVNRIQVAQQKRGQKVLEVLDHPDVEIGVKAGTSYVSFAQERFPKAVIRPYPEWEPDIVDAVLKGEIVAAFHDEIEIKKLIAGKPDTALELQTVVLKDTQDPIAMVVPWDSTHLLSWLNTYLNSTNLDLTADSILQEYSESFTPDHD